MAKETGWTPAMLRAFVEGDMDNFMAAAIPGGIERQEAEAQQELRSASKLPKEGTIQGRYGREAVPTNKAALEAIGFVFGEEIDDLFVACQLPQGWSIELSDHSMWSHVVDDKGRQRMPIFYKGAFYDRSAFLSVNRRYGIAEWRAASPDLPEEDYRSKEEYLEQQRCMTVVDHDRAVLYHTAPYTNAEYRESDVAREECAAWLAVHYPEYENPFAYWD